MMARAERSLVTAFLILTPMGCGGNGNPSHVRVSGTITLNGAPLAGAQVTFIPINDTQGIGAEARTEADGRYQLIDRRGKPGTEPGAYKVTISKRLMPDGSEVPVDDKTPPIRSPARESLPPYYSDASRTRLQVVVPEQGGTIDFPLKGQGK
jgi:hypothetical protein